jgi:EmrB/QacA subfamily drug resistance transporter
MEKRWKVLLITSVGLFMASLDLFIVNLAFPDIQREFEGTSISSLSWVLNAYAIVFAALLVPAGRWADRVGRRRAFVSGLLTFAAASAACAVSPSVLFLVGARIVQAIGAAMLLPATLGLILPAFPPEQRPLAVGIWSAVGGVAAALGPPLGGLLVQLSWNWIFIVNVPIGLVTALIAVRSLDEVRDPVRAGRPDLLGAVELVVGLGLLTGAIVKGPDWGWGDPAIIAGFATAAVLIAAFVRRSAAHPAPVIELPLLRVRDFALGNTAALLFFAGFSAMLLSFVLLLQQLWGYSVLEAGLALIPGPAMAALFAGPAGRIGGRIGQGPVVAVGGVAWAIGALWALAFTRRDPGLRLRPAARFPHRGHRGRSRARRPAWRGHRGTPSGAVRDRGSGVQHGSPARCGDRRRDSRRRARRPRFSGRAARRAPRRLGLHGRHRICRGGAFTGAPADGPTKRAAGPGRPGPGASSRLIRQIRTAP